MKFKGTGDIFIQGDDPGKLGMEIAKAVRTAKVMGEEVELDEKTKIEFKPNPDDSNKTMIMKKGKEMGNIIKTNKGFQVMQFGKPAGKVFKSLDDIKPAIRKDMVKKMNLMKDMKYTHVAVDKITRLVIGFASDEKDAKDMAKNDGKVVKLKKPMSDKKGNDGTVHLRKNLVKKMNQR